MTALLTVAAFVAEILGLARTVAAFFVASANSEVDFACASAAFDAILAVSDAFSRVLISFLSCVFVFSFTVFFSCAFTAVTCLAFAVASAFASLATCLA